MRASGECYGFIQEYLATPISLFTFLATIPGLLSCYLIYPIPLSGKETEEKISIKALFFF
jgi:hypothetical protein